MRAVLSWFMRSRWHAALFTLLTGMVNGLSVLGAGMVALSGLRQGPQEGLLVALLAATGLAAVGAAAGVAPGLLVISALAIWLPVLFAAWVLSRTGSQGRAVQSAGAFGAGAILAFFLGTDAPGEIGREFVEEYLKPAAEQLGNGETPEPEVLEAWAGMVPGMLGAALSLAVIAGVLLGRWWQAVLYNPGGFRAEFHELRHGLGPMLVMGAILVLPSFTEQGWALSLALIAMLLLLMQGLSVLHALVYRKGMTGFWLVPVYGLLVLLPIPAMASLAGIGIVDNVADLRARFAPAPPGGPGGNGHGDPGQEGPSQEKDRSGDRSDEDPDR